MIIHKLLTDTRYTLNIITGYTSKKKGINLCEKGYNKRIPSLSIASVWCCPPAITFQSLAAEKDFTRSGTNRFIISLNPVEVEIRTRKLFIRQVMQTLRNVTYKSSN